MAKCSYEDGNEAVFEEKEICLCEECLETTIKDNRKELLTEGEEEGWEDEPSEEEVIKRYRKLLQENEVFYRSEIVEIRRVVSSYSDRGI